MHIETKNEILDILNMPEAIFNREIVPEAHAVAEKTLNHQLIAAAMIGYTNICRCQCLYCGMRAGNPNLKRYRVPADEVIRLTLDGADHGLGRAFLIAGEDPKYGFDQLLEIVSALHKRGIFISLACGEFEQSQYAELHAAGADEYVLKFEMSNPESFNRLNPSTTFEKRMHSIETIRSLGIPLASGNIIDWPGQTVEELADDIMLMKQLDICWAPSIPYVPALGTPLAESHCRGSLLRLYKEIAILRIMMPSIRITAQQPGEDLRKGLSDPEANLAAIKVGANALFYDLLPDPYADSFSVISDRNITGFGHIDAIAKLSGYEIDTGKQFLH